MEACTSKVTIGYIMAEEMVPRYVVVAANGDHVREAARAVWDATKELPNARMLTPRPAAPRTR